MKANKAIERIVALKDNPSPSFKKEAYKIIVRYHKDGNPNPHELLDVFTKHIDPYHRQAAILLLGPMVNFSVVQDGLIKVWKQDKDTETKELALTQILQTLINVTDIENLKYKIDETLKSVSKHQREKMVNELLKAAVETLAHIVIHTITSKGIDTSKIPIDPTLN